MCIVVIKCLIMYMLSLYKSTYIVFTMCKSSTKVTGSGVLTPNFKDFANSDLRAKSKSENNARIYILLWY